MPDKLLVNEAWNSYITELLIDSQLSIGTRQAMKSAFYMGFRSCMQMLQYGYLDLHKEEIMEELNIS
jgi:hypothetical protein